MASRDPVEPRRRPQHEYRGSTLRQYYSNKPSPVTVALLVFPVFAIYQIGILVSPLGNGVDLFTFAMAALVEHSLTLYLGLNLVLVGVFAVVVLLGREGGGFDARVFGPMLLESGFYAMFMGTFIVFVMRELLGLGGLLAVPPLASTAIAQLGLLERVIVSCGAGFHEELVFRLILFGGMAWGLERGLKVGRWPGLIIAALVSSLAFSLIHHVGPLGEPFAMGTFVYRFMAGLFFAALYRLRNFAVVVYTHTLYDVFVLLLG